MVQRILKINNSYYYPVINKIEKMFNNNHQQYNKIRMKNNGNTFAFISNIFHFSNDLITNVDKEILFQIHQRGGFVGF